MKVTALIPDALVQEVNQQARGKNLTECLVIALKEWLALKKISSLNLAVATRPLKFSFSASQLRLRNRRHRDHPGVLEKYP